ncbi:MAG: bifunctional oligoribonuclease/PAP phosphatase NrnA [Clostridia bacterium]|nr:bifunctional oligoribonuclease/PAP phosphatase NrnA [Clostridia bacterium]
MFEKITEAIETHDPIILHRHLNPDGDALGSQIGLKHLILKNYPGKTVYIVGDEAGRYAFMEDSVMDEPPDAAYATALAIILDTSGKSLISDSRFSLAACTARIDHHLFLEQIAQIEVVDTTYESCCGLVAQMAIENSWQLDAVSASSLFIGMVTDSGRFRYDATRARTFRLAAFLMEQPIDTKNLYRNLYTSDLEQARLQAQFVMKIQRTRRGAAFIYTTREELAALDTDWFSISRGMVNVMADLRGVDIWANFTETDHGVVAELRSSRLNICPVAMRYGGGGHAKACGATLRTKEEAMALLGELDAMLEEGP